MDKKWTRRDFLASSAIGVAAMVSLSSTASAQPKNIKRKRVIRIAHLTDIHVQPELKAGEGMIACLHHVQSLVDKPDLIINGGDAIMDSLTESFSRTKTQWQLWKKILQNECSIPIRHCLGNHDVWGWGNDNKHLRKNPKYGKQWAMEVLELEQAFYHFDLEGWRFFVLDSVYQGPKIGYIARFSNAQFAWLEVNLSLIKKTTPVIIISHIPILSASAYLDGYNEKTGNWVVPGQWMHIDARKLKNLFLKYPNVKLCISGHIHLVDRVEYNNVTYLCNGAVCGKWWEGDYQECPPGYAIIDLYDDGSFEREYISYDWKPSK